MEQKNIAEILLKYELGVSSKEENKLIESWYNMQRPEHWILDTTEQEARKNKIFLGIQQQIAPKPMLRKPLYRKLGWISAAAAILLFSLVFLFDKTRQDQPDTHAAIDQFKPGQEKAILKLDNGSSFDLNGSKAGVKIVNGTPVYLDGSAISDAELQSHELTIQVPNGGQYQVNLPDGTKVWLNSASTLKYPLQFAAEKREVSLSGEAYFEVSKNPHQPFIVKSRNQEVKVLGTIFNINSYSNRQFVETTLLEGSVNVNQHRLVPGQRSLISNMSIQILPANIEAAIAWKKGYFLFDNEPLDQILATLSRWYNVEFEYESLSTKQLTFWGSIDKNQSLRKTLTFLESTDQLKFDYKNGKIVVHNKK
jgi:Fe2+-dicitrate sensor, membrane component